MLPVQCKGGGHQFAQFARKLCDAQGLALAAPAGDAESQTGKAFQLTTGLLKVIMGKETGNDLHRMAGVFDRLLCPCSRNGLFFHSEQVFEVKQLDSVAATLHGADERNPLIRLAGHSNRCFDGGVP